MRSLRFKIEPGDVPAYAAAQRMGLTESAFVTALPELVARGFPAADPTTGFYDLQAIDEWRRARHRVGGVQSRAFNAEDVLAARLPRLAHG